MCFSYWQPTAGASDNTVTAQLNTKLIFRTVRASDMQTIQEETDLSADDIRRLPYLQSGDVFISESRRPHRVRAHTKTIRRVRTENPFDELKELAHAEYDKARKLLWDKLPVSDPVQTAKHIEAEGNGTYTGQEIERMLEQLLAAGEIEAKENILGMKTYKMKEN